MNGKIISLAIVMLMILGGIGAVGTHLETNQNNSVEDNDCGCGDYIATDEKTTGNYKSYRYALGLISEDPEDDNALFDPVTLSGNPPDSWDWRNVDGKDWTTAIRDQENCGSCWAFGALSAMETIYNIQQDNPNLDVDLSEQYLVSCGMKYYPFGLKGCCGGKLSKTLDFLQSKGTVEENKFTYQAVDALGRDFGDCDGGSSHDPVKCPSLNDPLYKIGNYYSLATGNSIKNAIHDYGPVVTSFDVYEDFFNYDGGIYEQQSSNYVGGHLVAIVGYNDAQSYWICKNSWGTNWGENGWFKIGYGECNIDSPFNSAYFKTCSKSKTRNIDFPSFIEKMPLLQYLLQFPIFEKMLNQ